MPNVTIEVRTQYTPQEEEQIIEAVHAALMEGLKTPEWDKTIRLVAHAPHRFAAPPGRGERYTLVDIDLFSGRAPRLVPFAAQSGSMRRPARASRVTQSSSRSATSSVGPRPCT